MRVGSVPAKFKMMGLQGQARSPLMRRPALAETLLQRGCPKRQRQALARCLQRGCCPRWQVPSLLRELPQTLPLAQVQRPALP